MCWGSVCVRRLRARSARLAMPGRPAADERSSRGRGHVCEACTYGNAPVGRECRAGPGDPSRRTRADTGVDIWRDQRGTQARAFGGNSTTTAVLCWSRAPVNGGVLPPAMISRGMQSQNRATYYGIATKPQPVPILSGSAREVWPVAWAIRGQSAGVCDRLWRNLADVEGDGLLPAFLVRAAVVGAKTVPTSSLQRPIR